MHSFSTDPMILKCRYWLNFTDSYCQNLKNFQMFRTKNLTFIRKIYPASDRTHPTIRKPVIIVLINEPLSLNTRKLKQIRFFYVFNLPNLAKQVTPKVHKTQQ